MMGAIVCSAHFFILLEGEGTGRLLRYDPPTKTTHVVLDGLVFPNGVQISKDQSFLLFTETTNCRFLTALIISLSTYPTYFTFFLQLVIFEGKCDAI